MTVSILGAGVAGLCAATVLAERGVEVEVIDTADPPQGASRLAGGMLAPFVEAESAPPEVLRLGRGAADWWAARVPGVVRGGTLVVAPPRDAAELRRFAAAAEGHEALDAEDVAALEPDLAGRFRTGLHFAAEAHLDPRRALSALADGLRARGVPLRFGTGAAPRGRIVDCRGIAARDRLPALRAVRGEMLVLRSDEIRLSRAVRLLHPRFPLYIVPRGDGRFMLGATMVESDRAGPVTARGAMELLSAAFALHPALAEAEVVETGAGLRPAFPDNLPAVVADGDRLHLNGFFRHGFLLAPAMAERLADRLGAAPPLDRPALPHPHPLPVHDARSAHEHPEHRHAN